jgi:ATP-binding cassette subfamily B protein
MMARRAAAPRQDRPRRSRANDPKASEERVRPGAVMRNCVWALGVAWAAAPRLVAISTAVVFLRSLIPVMLIVCVRGLVDGFRETADVGNNVPWLIMLPALIVTGAVLNSVANYVNLGLRDELDMAVNLGLLTHAVKLDLAFFEDPANQDLMNRAHEHSARHCETLVADVAEFARNCFQLVVLTGLVLWLNPLTTAILGLLAIPYGMVQMRMSIVRYWREHRRAVKVRWTRYYTSQLTTHQWIPEIKVFNLAPLFIDRYRRIVGAFRDENRGIQFRLLGTEVFFAVIFTAALCLLGYRVVIQALAGTITPGNVAALMLAAERLYATVSAQIRVLSRVVHSSMMVANLQEFHRSEPRHVPQGNLVPEGHHGAVEFRDVTFTYPGCERPALDGVSLTIEPGEVVALVGQNGAGKSTLVKLLARLYLPDSGAVYLDGHDASHLSERSLRTNVAFVMQSFAQYEATAAENIAYGDWQRLLDDPAAVREIARRVGIDETIRSLPHGYDTMLGRTFGEAALSGGQWQTLAIARALAGDAKIIVFDEPTSGLDPKREFETFAHFRKLVRGRTAIIISHRFSTVRLADRIVVLDEGRLVESGTHRELLVAGGMYARMYNLHRQILDGAVMEYV